MSADIETSPTPDGPLVQAARGGDREAFARLFARHAPMIHGIGLCRVGPSEARDLVQDVFVAALEAIGDLREPEAFGAWLARIARNRATDLAKARKRDAPEERADEAAATGADGATRTEALRILALVQTLPEAYQETLVLRLVEGMTGPEIAAQVGLTPESVRVNLHRGMKLLREKLEAK